MEKDLFGLQSGGDTLHRFSQTGIDRLTHVGNDGRCLHRHADGQCGFPVDEKSVPLRLGESALHAGDVADTHRLSVQRPNRQVADVLLVFDGRIDVERDPLVAAGVFPRIDFLAGRLQGRYDLCGNDAVAGDLFFGEYDVDYLVAATDDVDALDALHVEQFAAEVFGIAVHFGIIVTVGRKGIENTVDIRHIVYHHRSVAPLRKTRRDIVYLAAEQVEILLQLLFQHGHLKLDGEHRRTVPTLGLYLLDIRQGAQFVLHKLRHV